MTVTSNKDLLVLLNETRNPVLEQVRRGVKSREKVLRLLKRSQTTWLVAWTFAITSFMQNGLDGFGFWLALLATILILATYIFCSIRVQTAWDIDELCAYMRREPLQVVEILNSGMPVERIMAKEHIANHHTPRVRKILTRLGIRYQQEEDEWKTICGHISTFTR